MCGVRGPPASTQHSSTAVRPSSSPLQSGPRGSRPLWGAPPRPAGPSMPVPILPRSRACAAAPLLCVSLNRPPDTVPPVIGSFPATAWVLYSPPKALCQALRATAAHVRLLHVTGRLPRTPLRRGVPRTPPRHPGCNMYPGPSCKVFGVLSCISAPPCPVILCRVLSAAPDVVFDPNLTGQSYSFRACTTRATWRNTGTVYTH